MLSKIKSTLLSRSDGHILDLIYLTGWDTVDFVNPCRDFNHIYTKIPIIRYFSDFSSNVSKLTHTHILIHPLIHSYTLLYVLYTLLYVLYTFWYVLYLHTLLYVLTLIYILIHALMFFDTYTLYSLHTRLHTLIYLYHTLIGSYYTYILIETD